MYYKIQQMTRLYCTTMRSDNANKKFQPKAIANHQNIVVKWNLDGKLKVSNIRKYTGSFMSTYECVNLVTHINFTVLCTIEADFWSISSMLKQAVRSWNASLPNSLK